MNSQFKNSKFGFILYTVIIGLIVLSTIFVIWYMTLGYKLGTYGPDTRLGSVYIGGLTEDEIFSRLDEKINYWYSDDMIVFELRYQDYEYEFDRSLLVFNVETSALDIQDGKTNELLVSIQGADRDAIEAEIAELVFLDNVIDNLNLSEMINDMLVDASLMKSYSCIDVEDYLLDVELSIEEIGSATFLVPQGVDTTVMANKVSSIFEEGKIIIEGNNLFDINVVFGTTMNDAEMTVLSSAMLDLILETNFLIDERHYNPNIDFTLYTIDDYPYFARNSIINQIVNQSFSFYNPNISDYYFMLEVVDESTVDIKLYGLPFENNIKIIILHPELDYITQTTNNASLLQAGYNGVVIEVYRVTTDLYGNVVYDKLILSEFYPPIKEIIYVP